MSKISTRGWITIAIIVVIVIFIYFKYFKTNPTTSPKVDCVKNPNDPSCKSNYNPSVTLAPKIGDNFPLGKGSSGDNVKTYQIYLNSLGSSLKIDGVWGPLTEAASLKYTGFNSIPQDYFDSVVDPYGDLLSTYQENNLRNA